MPYHLLPQDLARFAPQAQAKITEALADHIGAPVAPGNTESAPAAPARDAGAPRGGTHAARVRVRPNWAHALIALTVATGLLAGGWAWLGRPQAGLPAGYGPVVSTAPTPSPTTPAAPDHSTSAPAAASANMPRNIPVTLAASANTTPPAVIPGAQPVDTIVVPTCSAQLCQVPGTNLFAQPGTIYDPGTGQTRAVPSLSPGATRYYCRVEHVRHCPA